MKLGGDIPWECLRKCLNFEPHDLIFSYQGSKDHKPKPFLCTQYNPNMKLNGIMHGWSLMNWLEFRVCDLISKVTGANLFKGHVHHCIVYDNELVASKCCEMSVSGVLPNVWYVLRKSFKSPSFWLRNSCMNHVKAFYPLTSVKICLESGWELSDLPTSDLIPKAME